MGEAAVAHTMNPIDVSTGVAFDEFRAAFKNAARPLHPAPLDRNVANLLGVNGIDADWAFGAADAVNPAEPLAPPDSP